MEPSEKLKPQGKFIPLLLTIFSHAPKADAVDIVSSTHYLKDGQTITSEYGAFKLGFFSPPNSKNRYVGIWFGTVSQQTVVWVANRENPINDSSAVFKIGNDGNLIVLDGKGNILWSSNVSTASNSAVGEFLDTGNLVLRSGDSGNGDNILWQSFEHPSDTFLAGMKFGMNLKTGENKRLISWKSSGNPSAGKFSLCFDPDGIPQIIIWNGTKRHYRSGQWNGQQFLGIPYMVAYQSHGLNVVNDKTEGRLYCIYSNSNKTISAFVLNQSGKLDRSYWDDTTSSFNLVWSAPSSNCTIYGNAVQMEVAMQIRVQLVAA